MQGFPSPKFRFLRWKSIAMNRGLSSPSDAFDEFDLRKPGFLLKQVLSGKITETEVFPPR
jgi:hypothetical protein